MPVRFRLSVIFFVGLFCQLALAQSVDELLAKHAQARGGSEKLSAVQAVKMTGKILIIPFNDFRKAAGAGQEYPLTLLVKYPNRVRLELDQQGKKTIFGFDGGENAWALRPDATEPDKLFEDEGGMGEMQALLLLDLADLQGPLVNAKEKWRLVELEGKEGSGDAAVIRLKLTPKEGFVREAVLDGNTYLLSQTTRGGSDFQLETSYADYKPSNDVQFARTTEGRIDGELFARIRIDNVEVVSSLDDALFQLPANK
jgi:hypothetical protein